MTESPAPNNAIPVTDLGVMTYTDAYERQLESHARVLEAKTSNAPVLGEILLVEHPAVITMTNRPHVPAHLLAPQQQLAQQGIDVQETDRGGDITYHGPGQLVCYPVIDLEAAHIRLHPYMRALERAVIDTLAEYNIQATTDPDATGVWIPTEQPDPRVESPHDQPAKICAMGVRVRRWITFHGLALNVTTDLTHFDNIVPCGLEGRPVTSMRQLLADSTPPMTEVQQKLVHHLRAQLTAPNSSD